MLAELSKIAAFVPPLLSKVVVPATVTTPVSLMAPTAVTDRFWPTLTVPKSRAFTSVSETSLVPLLLRLTAPLKSFEALLRVIALAPAVKLEARSASIAPVWVIAPDASRVRIPVASEAAISIELPSLIETAAPAKSKLPKLAVVLSPKVTD